MTKEEARRAEGAGAVTAPPKPSIAAIAARFRCTPDQVRAQFAKNAATLTEMAEKAERTGRKVNQYTAAELREHAAEAAARSTEGPEMKVIITMGGERLHTTLGEFLADNADGLEKREADYIRSYLYRGLKYTGGGGAAGRFTIELDPGKPADAQRGHAGEASFVSLSFYETTRMHIWPNGHHER